MCGNNVSTRTHTTTKTKQKPAHGAPARPAKVGVDVAERGDVEAGADAGVEAAKHARALVDLVGVGGLCVF